MDIRALLQTARAQGASDLHLVANNPPVMRRYGALVRMIDQPLLNGADIDEAIAQITAPEARERFQRTGELDFSFSLPEGGRFRGNAARQLGTTTLVVRILPTTIPAIDTLGLPDICRELIFKPRGLIIISGPTGSGKSTTLAAMIDHLNRAENGKGKRVVTVEDPVEYIYTSQSCVITQRELGSDTQSFVEALRHVLRQDPDVILIGEMRDTETAAAALTIAETGHLVLTTGHAPSTAGAIERIIDLFPPHERSLVQNRLGSLLVAVLCQSLVPRADGAGMVAAVEVMLANAAVKNLIREGKIFQLANVIRTNQQEKMQLLDQALVKLYREGRITQQSLFAFCNDHDEVERTAGAAIGLDPSRRQTRRN